MVQEKMFNFKIEKTDEFITSHAGLTLVAELFKVLELDKMADFVMPKPGSSVGYNSKLYILPLTLTLVGGGNSLEDLRVISNDKTLLKLIEIDKVPSSDALGKWLLRTYDNGGYEGIEKINLKLIKEILKRDSNTEYTFDPDATVIESHKEEAKITYKKCPGYIPMLAVLAENSIFITNEFREGNVPPSANALEFLEQSINNMPIGKRIARLRSDSAWYQANVINKCNNRNIIFTITAVHDSSVMESVIKIKNWVPLKDKHGFMTDREIGETFHSMEKTEEAFRLVVQRYRPSKQLSLFGKEYNYYVIATNDENSSLEKIVNFHNERGNSENYNKEIKLGFGMRRMPCGEFGANAVFFRIGVLAYNLIVGLKYLALPKDWRTKTINTIRWQLIGIGGKLVKHSRKWILKLSGISEEIYNIFTQVRERYRELCGYT